MREKKKKKLILKFSFSHYSPSPSFFSFLLISLLSVHCFRKKHFLYDASEVESKNNNKNKNTVPTLTYLPVSRVPYTRLVS